MILEGLVTTCDADGRMHLAAMGPEADEVAVAAGRIERLVLKPFATSQTAVNLARLGAGVFHAIDDVLLLARVVTGAAAPPPACRPASAVRGWVLDDACRAFEFEIVAADRAADRERLEARVVATHEGRPFPGLNRARHAVVEGAILVTRIHLLGAEEVRRRLAELRVLVEKTGGGREHEAFGLLEARVG
ncbi:MAG: DUF447 family protein [Planctomycetia bacterium]|nr:DUF447 family protein [Planctomycetia bacterium]